MPGFWRKCRIAFRCVRITIWLLVLAALASFLWFNRVGLPDFLKTRFVATLREHGVELEFSRMRLSLIRGIVAENVRIGGTGTNYAPSCGARQVQLDLDFHALLRRRLELNGLGLWDANFALQLSPTNVLVLTNMNTVLRFGTNDTWSLDKFHADFAGARIEISGEVTHAREARDWRFFGSGQTNRGPVFDSLKTFADALDSIQFEGSPELKLNISGDARDVHSIVLTLAASATGVHTPWFDASDFQADFNLTAPADAPTNSDPSLAFWSSLLPFKLVWSSRLGELHSRNLDGEDLELSGLWAAPKLAVTHISGKLGEGRLAASALLDVTSRKLAITNDSNIDPHLLAGLLPGAANRQLAEIKWSRLPLLKAEVSLKLPPWDMPATNNSLSDDLASSLDMRGELAFTNVTIHGVSLDRLATHFSYSDWIWELPDLTVVQGRTQLRLSGQESEASKNIHFSLAGNLDLVTLQHWLTGTNGFNPLQLMTFHKPLNLDLDLSGNLHRLETLSVTGRVALADFLIRSEDVGMVSGNLTYSNYIVNIFQPKLTRAGGAQWFTADQLTVDITNERLFFDGGYGSIEPFVVGRAIGPITFEAMEPYQFLAIPTARVHGCVPLKEVNDEIVTDDADLWFDIVGTAPFRWKKFETPAITGSIHWWKDFIILTNAVAECYGGQAQGWGVFNVSPLIHGTDFNFYLVGTNVDLRRMGLALWSPTNKLEGTLSGTVEFTQANSEDWHTWNGLGRMQMRDGMLWDVPIFAFMSPVLNAVSPGLGNSRATEATATFAMTNGVIRTEDMQIRSTMMRLQYSGTVDMQENVHARVSAQLLRNTPVVGSLVSAVLWPVSKIFECTVTGTLENPVVKPVYIPKLLLFPLHPIRSLEELFSPSSGSSTNTPAAD